MAGWRVAFLVGNAEIVQGLTKLRATSTMEPSSPIQIERIVAMNEAPGLSEFVNDIYQGRATPFAKGWRASAGTCQAQGHDVRVGEDSRDRYQEMGSLGFSKVLVTEAKVATFAKEVGLGLGVRATSDSLSSRTNNG